MSGEEGEGDTGGFGAFWDGVTFNVDNEVVLDRKF